MRAAYVGALLLSSPVLAHPQSPSAPVTDPVTYTNAGAPAGRVLKDLTAKTGVTMTTSPMTDGDVVAVRLVDVPLRDAMVKIAWAVGGSWKKEGETYRLVRTAEDARAEQIRERDTLIKGFARALAKRREQLEKSGDFTVEKSEALAKEAAVAVRNFNPDRRESAFYQFSQRMSTESPSGRAMTRIMELVTPADLIGFPNGFKVVYSSNPTRTQRPISAKVAGIVATLRREQALWVESMTKHGVKNPTFGDTTYVLQGVYDADQPIEKVGKVLLTAARPPFNPGSVQFELMVADTGGKVISRSNAYIYVGSDLGPGQKPVDPPKDDPKVKRTADIEVIVESFANGAAKPIPDDLRLRLLRPEENEPLAILAGGMIISLAEARKVNLVSALSETGFLTFIYSQKEFPSTQFVSNLKTRDEVLEEDGWIATRPLTAVTARQARVDRRLLGQFIRRKLEVPNMKVDEQAAWAIKMPAEEAANLSRSILALLTASDRYRYTDARLLRFFGSLTQQQRAIAKQEGGLPMGSLSPDQQYMIQQMVYGQNAFLQVDYQKAQEAKINVNDYYNGIMREPTESLPNGIPPDGRLELIERTDEVAFTSDQQNQQYTMSSRGMTPSEMAWQKFSTDRADLFPWANQPYNRIDLSRLRMGKRTNYMLSFKFTPILSLQNQLEDRDYTMSEPVSYDRLPAAFRKLVDEQMAQYAKSYANHQPRPATTTTVPPPP